MMYIMQYREGEAAKRGWPSFRGDAKHRTRNLEIPGLVLAHHPGMTESGLLRRFAPRNDEKEAHSLTQQACNTSGPSPTMSGCRASPTAGDIRITSAWAPKI